MKKIKFFNSIAEARLAENLLKQNGIESSVWSRGVEFGGDMGDSYGADLIVAEKDVEKAKEILGISVE